MAAVCERELIIIELPCEQLNLSNINPFLFLTRANLFAFLLHRSGSRTGAPSGERWSAKNRKESASFKKTTRTCRATRPRRKITQTPTRCTTTRPTSRTATSPTSRWRKRVSEVVQSKFIRNRGCSGRLRVLPVRTLLVVYWILMYKV